MNTSRDFVVLLFLDTFEYGKCPETGDLTKFFEYFKGFCRFTVSRHFVYEKCQETWKRPIPLSTECVWKHEERPNPLNTEIMTFVTNTQLLLYINHRSHRHHQQQQKQNGERSEQRREDVNH